MEIMNKQQQQQQQQQPQPRKHQAAAAMVVPRSPGLTRSRSGTSTSSAASSPVIIPVPEKQTQTSSNFVASKQGAKEVVIKRSNSATKLMIRSSKGQVNPLSGLTNTTTEKIIKPHRRHQPSKDDNFKLLQRTQSEIIQQVPRRARSASTSPSAWALSTSSRTSISPASPVVPVGVPKSPSCGKLKRELMSRNGVSGVLKFFKQKKVSPALEQEYHQFRLMHTRLLQWRFANARAEASMAVLNRVAHKKLFNVWLRMSMLRIHIVEKRTEIQKLKQEIKLHHIFNSQFGLLKEWARLEAKNGEAVGRLARKLSAVSTCLPLVQGAEADVTSMYEAMSGAMRVLEGIKAMVADMQAQVEKACYMLTEFTVLLKEQKDYATELDKHLKVFSLLEVKEKSLRLQCIQLVKDSTIKKGWSSRY